MSIFFHSRKNSRKKRQKKDSIEQEQSLNMEKHLKEFAKEVNQKAAYKSEQNAVYRAFRKKMEQVKKK